MIEKNQNINQKSVKRLIAPDAEYKQINILDQRFYKRNDEYYPSVTSILNAFPKGKYFEEWLKTSGFNADAIVRKAAEEGTQVHQAIENLLKGEEVKWIEDNGYVNYSLDIWKMILKFQEFWSIHKPTLIESEIHLFSDQHKIAGTCDLVLEMNGEKWILDIKTSNSLHTTYDLQTSAYVTCWNELFEEPVQRRGVLWLKASTRGEDKSGKKIQGKGWQIVEYGDYEKSFQMFLKVYDIFKLEFSDMKPYSETYPVIVKL